jgi:hypothetical protein
LAGSPLPSGPNQRNVLCEKSGELSYEIHAVTVDGQVGRDEHVDGAFFS